MGRSAFISAALHAAILLWIVVILPGGDPLDGPPIREIPIEILPPSELTKIKAGTQDAKSEAPLAPKPEAEKPSAVKEKAPDTPQTASAPPKAEPTPPAEPEKPAPEEQAEETPPEPPEEKQEEAPPPPEDEAPPEEAAEDTPPPSMPLRRPPPPKQVAQQPKPKPKPQPQPQQRQESDFNTDRLAALLNKIPDAGEQPRADNAPPDMAEQEVHGQTNGTELTMSVNEIDALRSRIAQCWNPPPGGLGADRIVVKLRMRLNEDGTLLGYPTVENRGGSPFFQAAADSAVRAVYACQPYILPAEKYSLWHDMILNFDPSDMYRAG